MPLVKSSRLPDINYVRSGPKGAEPIVFLHDVGLDLTWWGRQIEEFGADHDVIAVDMPGHGLSGKLAGAPDFDLMADALQAVLAHSDVPVAHLVGVSVGGMIAQTFALQHPERIRSLTLVATLCTLDDSVREILRERARVARTQGMATIAALANARWFAPAFRDRRPDVLQQATISLLAQDPEFHASMWDMISGLDLEDRITAISCPTLVVAGSEDVNAPVSAARRIVESIGGAVLAEMAGLGHFPPVEAPVAFNTLLRRFLSAPPAVEG